MNLREGRIGVREGISIAAIAMCTSGLLTFDTKNTYACGNAAYITLPVGGIIALVFFIIVLAAMRRSRAKNLSEQIILRGGTCVFQASRNGASWHRDKKKWDTTVPQPC